jgi:hypothetical protein
MNPLSSGPERNPLSSGPERKPLSSDPDRAPRFVGPEIEAPERGMGGGGRGPERGPEFGIEPRGTGCRGRALKEDVLSKDEARSNRMLLEELLNCCSCREVDMMELGVAVLALTEAPEMALKEVSDMDLDLSPPPAAAQCLLSNVVLDLFCSNSPSLLLLQPPPSSTAAAVAPVPPIAAAEAAAPSPSSIPLSDSKENSHEILSELKVVGGRT